MRPSPPAGPAAATNMVGQPQQTQQQTQPAGTQPAATQQQPATQAAKPQQPAASAGKPAGTAAQPSGCVPACGQGRTCARITPSKAAAKLGAVPTWRCVPAPTKRTGRRLLEAPQ